VRTHGVQPAMITSRLPLLTLAVGLSCVAAVACTNTTGLEATSPSASVEPTPTTTAAAPCGSVPGSPADLAAEPSDWLAYGIYLRWSDADGCPVRIDVISHIRGAEHCDFESTEFITIGPRLGDSILDGSVIALAANRYVWDPEGVLPGGPYDTMIDLEDLPADVHDTGYRQGDAALWLSDSEPPLFYRVMGTTAQMWHPSAGVGICA
jgi:hypothetical protein